MKETRLFVMATAISSLLCLVMACATMRAATPPAPQTPKQAFILAAHETAAVMGAANDAVQQGLISAETHAKVLKGVEDARASLVVAQVAFDRGDLTTAAGQLQAANAALQTMRLVLTATGGGT